MGNAQSGSGPSASKRDSSIGPIWSKKTQTWTSDDDLQVSANNNYLTTSSCGLQLNFQSKTHPSPVGFNATNEFPVVLKYNGNAKNVLVSGSWDGWKRKIPLIKSTDDFTTIINLPEGRHEFRFIVDGRSICDHKFLRTDQNPLTGLENNLLVVDKADFEVFDALERDSQDVAASRDPQSNDHHSSSDDTSAYDQESTPAQDCPGSVGGAPASPRPFGQTMPDRTVFRGAHPPPALPPHLLQVILNKDTPVTSDPNVLPEPNHVMLNHLYALSIKDDVMVLSATHRYRKKYVTTLLYKPI